MKRRDLSHGRRGRLPRRCLSVFFLIIILLPTALTGCGRLRAEELSFLEDDGDSVLVVCTTFPQYDWVRQLTAECEGRYRLMLLLDNGGDMHSYQPTAADMMAVAACDIFLYVGGESDAWVEDAPEPAAAGGRVEVSLLEALGDAVREEETVEGMETGRREATVEEMETGRDEAEYDEHVWLSLRNARILVERIAEVLEAADADSAAVVAANADAYCRQLEALDRRYEQVVAASSVRTLLFGDRFPFRYLTEDYGLAYYAAFPGCSAETEASFRTIAFLAEKMDELHLPAVMVLENSDTAIAGAILNNSREPGHRILTLNSLQSVSQRDIADGVTYLSLMEENLAALKQALPQD